MTLFGGVSSAQSGKDFLTNSAQSREGPHKRRKALFLDRDGVINRDKGYVYRWEDFEFLPGVVDAMRRFSSAGYELVVVSNQSGIARGLFTESQFEALMSKADKID